MRRVGELIVAAEARLAVGASSAGSSAVTPPPNAARPGGIYLHANNVHVKVAFAEIVAVEADGDYSRVHLRDGRAFHELRSLRAWETVLPAADFLRVHRRHIVNLDHLQRLRRHAGGRWRVELANAPAPMAVGRQYQPALKRALALRNA